MAFGALIAQLAQNPNVDFGSKAARQAVQQAFGGAGRQAKQSMAATKLAKKGRGGDTMLGHLSPGEVVVPADVLAQPGVRERLLFGFAGAGLEPGRYTVGGRDDSRNPRTGMREYRGGGAEGTGDPGPGGGGGDAPSRTSAHIGSRETVASREAAASRAEARGFDPSPTAEQPTLAERIGKHVKEQVKAVREDFKALQEQDQPPGITGIVGKVAQMAIDDMFDDTPATPEQMAGHQADHAETAGGDPPAARARTQVARAPAASSFGPMDAANPLAALGDTGGEGSYWRPQVGGTQVGWLSRVNADIERARRAGRQRGGQQAGRIADPAVQRMFA